MKNKMNKYDESKGDGPKDQKWFNLVKIVVKTQEDKEQLLLASRYIHDLIEIDTDYMVINSIAHLYQAPELIKVLK